MTESQTDKTFHFFNTDGTQLVKFDLGDNATAEADGGDGGCRCRSCSGVWVWPNISV